MPLDSLTDEEVVQRAREAPDGDLKPYEVLVNRYRRKVLANCRYLTRSSADSEDLAQDVFLKLYFGLKGFEGRSAFRTWLMRVKTNHCLNWIKKKTGRRFVDVDDPAVEAAEDELRVAPKAERQASARDDREAIERVLDAMKDTLRIPLLMRDMDRMSYQEIAETLELGLSATKMRIKRARESFRELYERTAGTAYVE